VKFIYTSVSGTDTLSFATTPLAAFLFARANFVNVYQLLLLKPRISAASGFALLRVVWAIKTIPRRAGDVTKATAWKAKAAD
jgi:hypothetical protein